MATNDLIVGGLGYFGMPHILVRYMSIKSEKEMKKSQKIGIIWTAIILAMASVVGLVGHKFVGSYLAEGSQSMIFVTMVRQLFPAFIAGL